MTEAQATPEVKPQEGGSSNGQEPELTQEQLDQLPEWARTSLSKANSEAAKYRTERNQLKQVVDEVGGIDRVKHLNWTTTTREGIKSLFEELTDIDGIEDIIGVESGKLKSVLGKAETAAQQEAKSHEQQTGQPLSPEEVQKLVDAKVTEVVSGMTQRQNMEGLRGAVTNYLNEKGYKDEHSFSLITQLAAKHQADSDIDMNAPGYGAYIQAIDKGIEDFEKWSTETLGAKREDYLRSKEADAAGAPRAVQGSTPATGEKWDPSNLEWDELTKQAKDRGYYD